MNSDDSIIFTDAMNGIASGPGSQPAEGDGAELDILQLPSGMETYATPILPEPEQVAHLSAARRRLQLVLQQLQRWDAAGANARIDLRDLDEDNRELVDQVMGEGEVSILFDADATLHIQESVLTGVWRIQQRNAANRVVNDAIEIGPIPAVVNRATFAHTAGAASEAPQQIPGGVCNAPPLLAEINERIAAYQSGDAPYTINLTLLPQTEQDLLFLDRQLGQGTTTILSRGYGNCRITSTATRNVWWVQYFNSQDKNILNSLEICAVPEVACAAPEDIADSAERLAEILEIYQ